jgi:hypothetical protein
MKKALLVVGMHRSGTSALAGALSLLGVDVGEDLLPAKIGENERGFFELKEVHSFHERLLLSGGRTWDTPSPLTQVWLDRFATPSTQAELVGILERNFSGSDLWAVKDPRLCQLLPLWRDVLTDLGVDLEVIHIVRDPAAVARSLANRDGFPAEKSGVLWLDHNLAAEHDSRGLRRALLTYEGLLDRKMDALEDLAAQLDITWPESTEATATAIESFLTRDLDHTGKSSPSPTPGFGRWTEVVTELDRLLGESSGAGEGGYAAASDFDQLRARHRSLVADLDPMLLDHCTHLALGAGGIRELQLALDATENALETAQDYAWQVESSLETAQSREEDTREFIASLEKDLDAHRVHGSEVSTHFKKLEASLQEKETLIRELENEVAKQAELIAGHEQDLRVAAHSTQNLESELEKHQELQKELTRYTQKLVSELERQQHPASSQPAPSPAEPNDSPTSKDPEQGHK